MLLLQIRVFLLYLKMQLVFILIRLATGICDIPSTHLSWVQLNWRVSIIRRLKYNEEIIIKTWAKEASKVTTIRDFEVLDKNGKQVCIATTKWTLTNIDTQSIVKITDDIICKYEPDTKSIMPEYKFKKLQEPENFYREYIYKTERRDIDVNNHMHNLNYLDLAYETLPENIYLNSRFDNIEIMYKKAIRLSDTSKCLYSFNDGKHTIVIKSLDEKDLHCIVNLW